MPFYRVKKYASGRRARRGGGVRGRGRKVAMAAARMRLGGRMYNPTPTFTETVRLTNLNTGTTGTGAAGLLAIALSQIPQVGDYQALYNQYCIRSVQFIICPEYDQYDSNNASTAPAAAVTAPRFVYAINDSATQTTPTDELDVLQDNGAKIRMLDKPIRIRFRPVAQVRVTDSNNNLVYETKKNRWLSMTDTGVAHSGVAWAITQTVPNSVLSLPACIVYAKITFSLRDPK